jgi:hypothetical protein
LQADNELGFWYQLHEIYTSGTEHKIMVAGTDRVDFFKNNLKKLNGIGNNRLFNFKIISFIENARDASAEGMITMSASSLRNHAASNRFEEFVKLLPHTISDKQAQELFADVRQGMLRSNA